MNFNKRVFCQTAWLTLLLLLCVVGGYAQQEECATRITLLKLYDVYEFATVDRWTRGGIGRVITM